MSEKREWTLNDMYDQEVAAGRTNLSRRTFCKYAGITAAGMAALGITAEDILAEDAVMGLDGAVLEDYANETDEFFEGCEKFYAACSPECQHHNLCAYVKDGQVVKVGIGKNNESTPCLRGFARVAWLNSPERLTKPLLRDGEKGSNTWKEISWDEALDLMATKLQDAINTDGNGSIVFDGHAGNFHALVGQVANAFTSRLGGTATLTGTLCCAGANGAVTPIWGKRFFDCRNTIAESDYIIIWGNNPAVSKGGYWSRFQDCMKKGGKVVVIDPVKSEAAKDSTEWVPIKPTTDAALALGMLKVIVEQDLHNKEFLLARTTAPCLVGADGQLVLVDEADATSYAVYDTATGELVRHDAEGVAAALSVADTDLAEAYTTVYDLILAEAAPWTPEAVEAETGVPAETVTRLALEYAAAGRAMIIQNMGGFMRHSYGTDSTAAQMNLANFCGQVGARGNGVSDAGGINNLYALGSAWDNPAIPAGLPSYPRVKFSEMVANDEVGPINVFVSYRESPMTQWPHTNSVKAMLKKVPFVVVIDTFMTSTALYADLVLPCAAVFEREDVLLNARSHLVHLSEQAILPPGEAKDDIWILGRLAERMGFGEDFQRTNAEMCAQILEPAGFTYEQLKEEKAIDAMPAEFVPYENGVFLTKTTKAELYQPSWLAKGHPGVPTYIRCDETVGGASGLDAKYPLAAVQRKLMTSVHSTFADLEPIKKVSGGVAHIMINAADAAARGIENDAPVVAYNDRGEHRGLAIVTDEIMPGVVCLENGHWEQHGGSSSYVTNNNPGVLTAEHCCNETLVEVRLDA